MIINKTKIIFGIIIFSLSIVLITIITLKINNNERIILNCNKELKCVIKANVKKYQVSNISMNIKLSKNAKLDKVNIDPSWNGDGEDGRIELYTDENKKGTFPIGDFKISLKDQKNKKIEIIIDNIILYDENFEEHTLNKINKKIVI